MGMERNGKRMENKKEGFLKKKNREGYDYRGW